MVYNSVPIWCKFTASNTSLRLFSASIYLEKLRRRENFFFLQLRLTVISKYTHPEADWRVKLRPITNGRRRLFEIFIGQTRQRRLTCTRKILFWKIIPIVSYLYDWRTAESLLRTMRASLGASSSRWRFEVKMVVLKARGVRGSWGQRGAPTECHTAKRVYIIFLGIC